MLIEEEKIKNVEEKLSILTAYIKANTSINLNDICIISEDFFCKLLNCIFEYKLINANTIKNNYKIVDLIDEKNKVIFQITANERKDKVQNSLNKYQEEYDNTYKLKFLILSNHKNYSDFKVKKGYSFDKKEDILFIEDLIKKSRVKIDEVNEIIEENFFEENIKRKIEWYNKLNQLAIKNIGPRYNKDIDIKTETYKKIELFTYEKDRINELLLTIKRIIIDIQKIKYSFISEELYLKLKDEYENCIFETKIFEIINFKNLLENAKKEINDNIKNFNQDECEDAETINIEVNKILNNIDYCIEILGIVSANILVLKGNMGTGKSHVLASYIKNDRVDQNKEAVFLLGQNFISDNLLKTQIKDELEIEESLERFIKELNAIGKEKKMIVPIVIDALNESANIYKWKSLLNELSIYIKDNAYVKLIVSVRSEYIDRCIPDDTGLIIEHNGFDEEENLYSIVDEIFTYYEVPIPLFPIINVEYTNPLFLISICKWIKKCGKNILIDSYNSFEKIFDAYLEEINKNIAKKLKYNSKNNLVKEVLILIIKYMTENKKNSIEKNEFMSVEKDLLSYYGISPIKMVEILESEGIVFVNHHLEKESVYFSYEQYNCILKAKYYIEESNDNEHIDIENIKKIIENNSYDIELVKNLLIKLGNNYGIEIYDIFDDLNGKTYINKAYVKSLMWRIKNNFDKNKKFNNYKVNIIEKDYSLNQLFFSILHTCSAITDSPFNIYEYNEELKKLSMAERDYKYTIKINNNDAIKMTQYCMAVNAESISDNNRTMLCLSFGWLLGSPTRLVRDTSTKAIVNLLTDHIQTMEKFIKSFCDVNDEYILERVCSCCYGALLRSEKFEGIEKICDIVYKAIFDKKKIIPNILIRYYAQKIILFSIKNGAKVKINNAKITPPYKSEWYKHIPTEKEIGDYLVDINSINKDNIYLLSKNEIIESMLTESAKKLGMYGDFGRYYFERVISIWKHDLPEQELSNIVIKRVFDLGYDVEKFGLFDQSQKAKCYNSRYEHNFERIGKKYQWIAMYELLGKIDDRYEQKGDYNPFYYLLDIDTSNLIKLKVENNEELLANENWYKEEESIEKFIDINNFYSLKRIIEKSQENLELKTSNDIFGEYKYESKLTIILQAYLFDKSKDVTKIKFDRLEIGGSHDSNCMLLEHSLYHNGDKDDYEDAYLTNYEYRCNSEYDMTCCDNHEAIYQPSNMIIDTLNLEQDKNGYWKVNGNVICYDEILGGNNNNLIINKKKFLEFLEKAKKKVVWVGYIKKKYENNIKECRVAVTLDDNEIKIIKKWDKQKRTI